jgi:hypothetical protein|tara:strand:- start:441 stop:1349 length:909 start_codon:yes stop_codon:yes gene_type:complete
MKNKNLPGIAIFAYNRPNHLKRTIKNLIQNYNSANYDIYFFCNGLNKDANPKKHLEIQNIIKRIKHFNSKKVFLRTKNIGLANNILQGVSEVFKKKKSVIIIEDDIITNKNYLNYMSGGLDFFKNDKLIGTITGYSFTNIDKLSSKDIYLSQRHASWGWGTWSHVWHKMRWDKKWILSKMNNKNFKKNFNNSGKDMHTALNKQLNGYNDALDILVNLNCFIMNRYSVCPKKSLLYNVGLDGSGTHCRKGDQIFNNFSKSFGVSAFQKIYVEKKIIRKIKESFSTPIYIRIYNKLKKIFFNRN